MFAVDGDLSRRVMAVAEVVGASAATLLVTSPAWVFAYLGGWQPAHAALWLGALTTLPLGPAAVALLTTVRRVLLRRAPSPHPVRGFLAALLFGLSAWRVWAVGAAIVLVIGYQLTIMGTTSTAVLAPTVLLAVICGLAGCAVSSGMAAQHRAPAPMAAASLRAALKRPTVLCVWAFVTALAALAPAIPLVGPTLAFLAPAGWAVAVVVVNVTFGFDDAVEASRTHRWTR